jgi:hypothetical protein
MRACCLFLLLFPASASAQVEPMPALERGGDPALAARCAGGGAEACTGLADERFHAADGRTASALYRRAADLARLGTPGRALPAAATTVRSSADALASLEAQWDTVVVTAATPHGVGAMARGVRRSLFGPSAVSSWQVRRASGADAFAAAHTLVTREGGVFRELVWMGDPTVLAAAGTLFELTFGYMNLDFAVYMDDAGRIVAICHFPEG